MGGDTGAIERVYRRRRRPPLLQLGVAVLIGGNALLHAGRFGDPHGDRYGPPSWMPWSVGVLFTATLVRIALEQLRAYTRVTASGISVQGRLRSRSWYWADVYDIRVEPSLRGSGSSGPRWLTYLYDFEGRRHLLWHLDDWQLGDPYAEVSELCLAAAPYRSLAWEPSPRVEELIRRGAARRKAWIRAGYSALVVFFAMFVVDFWEVVTGRPEHLFLLLVVVPLAFFGAVGAVLQRLTTGPAAAQP
ncbi:PH domain-containing protein [Streptomyces sp. NPDC058954]|uniref:PH domain-containing protein n=1 Tax=Streptomyces sp. NPDC058954 TaxID=3346677 RepID=UPI003694545E